MKKLILTLICILAVYSTVAGPRAFRPAYHPPHNHHVHHQHHQHHHVHNSWIAPSIVSGAIIGSTIVSALTEPAPVVVAQPTVVVPSAIPVTEQITVIKQPVQVWVEGRYIDQIQPNGAVLRVWQPGHYETIR